MEEDKELREIRRWLKLIHGVLLFKEPGLLKIFGKK
jgi:hypothetical protein